MKSENKRAFPSFFLFSHPISEKKKGKKWEKGHSPFLLLFCSLFFLKGRGEGNERGIPYFFRSGEKGGRKR
jgi:hypothetical protein